MTNLKRSVQALSAKIGARDFFIGAGVLLSAAGAWMVYPPAGFISAGLVLLLLGIFGVPKWP